MTERTQDPVLKGVLAEDSLEAARGRSLVQGKAIMRRRKGLANAGKGGLACAAMMVIAAGIFLAGPGRQGELARKDAGRQPARNGARASVASVAEKGAENLRFISDEELLALFPGRALALIGPAGHKELVFLDETEGVPADRYR